jgi:GTP-binding protein EngB required for normal cell division
LSEELESARLTPQEITALAAVNTRDSDLADLLRKCHRDELEPLASMLRIKSAGMPMATLAKAIDHRFRRAATSEVFTVLRGGNPPDYVDVLRQTGVRLGIELPQNAPVAELAIVRQQVRKQWSMLSPVEQRKRWLEAIHTTDASAPAEAEAVMAVLDQRYRQGVGLFLTRLVTEPVVPLPGCLVLLWFAKPKDEIVLPAVVEICRLRHAVRHRVTVGIVGSPSSGKDAAMSALFGIDTGNVNPVAGSTRQVEIRRLPQSTALFVVNTPGMGDVIESVTEEARQVLDHIDVYLYLVNAQGGVQAREKADHEACRRRGRPVLVVINKIDTLRDADRDRFLADCSAKLRVEEGDLLPVAFDPLPQLSPGPIGLEAVQGWIEEKLVALGKDPGELPWNAARQAGQGQ